MSTEAQIYVSDLMQRFRDLVVEIEEEQNDLTKKLRDLSLETGKNLRNSRRSQSINRATTRGESGSGGGFISFPRDHRSNSNSNSTSSETNTNPSSFSSTQLTATASPTDEPSGATTISSGILSIATTGGSTKPPSYKTAIKRGEVRPNTPPLPPPVPIQQHSQTNPSSQRYHERSHHHHHHHNHEHQIDDIPQRPPRNRSRRSNTIHRSEHLSPLRSLIHDSSDNTPTLTSLINRSLPRPKAVTTMTTNGVARGALIVFEGLDRVGKSTLAIKLVKHLENTKRPVSYMRFPERETPVGQLINSLLKDSSKIVDDHTMHLLFSANRWEMSKSILQTLRQGVTVVLDRYAYSGIAYSSAKSGLSIDWCRNTERGLPKPDLVIYLELPKESQYKRPGFGDERFETQELQETIRRQYEKVVNSSRETWLRVDVENKGPEQVLGEIIIPVKNCIESSANKKLEELDFQ